MRAQVDVSAQCPHRIEIPRAVQVTKLQLIHGKLALIARLIQVFGAGAKAEQT
jgi:hypothetical protein